MLRCLLLIIFLALTLFAQTAKEQLILQAQELMQQNNFAGARQVIAQATKTYPNDAGFDNLRGIIEAQQGNAVAAETAFKKAITRSPKFTSAYLNLGRLYQENAAQFAEAPKKAGQIYQRILQYDPGHLEAGYQSAVLLQILGDYKTSLLQVAKLPPDFQQSAQVTALLCANYAGLENRAKADEHAAKLIRHSEFSEADVISLWPVLEAKKRTDLMVKLCESLIASRRATPEIFHRAGLVYEKLGQLEKAREYLLQATGNEQPAVGLLLELARVAHQQKDFQDALGYLAQARDLEPRNAAIHFSFGMVCANLNLGAEAYTAFGKALEIEPENATYNYAMGVAAMYRHDPGEAIPYLQKYLSLKPDDARGKFLLGTVYFKLRDYESAHRELQAALQATAAAADTVAGAHFYLGRIARQENKLDEAIRELGLALHLKPENADGYAELGQCFIQQKNYAQAGQSLQQALKIDADNYAANFNLLTLYSRTKDKREAEQANKFEAVKNKRNEQMQDFLRTIEVRER